MEQHVSTKFKVGQEFIIPPALVVQHRAPGVPGPIIGVEGAIKRLRFVCVPICEVTDLIRSDQCYLQPPFAVNTSKKALFVLHSTGQLER